MRLSRHTMYTRLFESLPIPLTGDILGISGLKYWTGSPHYKPPRQAISPDARITEADYPEVDMQKLPYPDASFDVVISDQVIEHIEGDVQKAVEETRRVLRPGGIFILTSVLLQPIHWGPKDMWRFSPAALRYLCRNFSEITVCEGWGNRLAHAIFFLYPKARDWEVPKRKISIAHYLANKNNSDYPLMVWIIAKK